MEAIILDGHLKSALAATRSLGEKGIRVNCAAERKSAMSLHSCFCAQDFIYPSPVKNRQAFIETLVEFAKKVGGKPLVYSFSDETFLPISDEREKLEKYVTLVLSDKKNIDLAFNKAKTLSLAKKLNVPHTNYYEVENLNDIKKISKKLSYPAVIKPKHSCVWKGNIGVKGTASYAFTPVELIEKAKEIYKKTGLWPLVQDFIMGEEYGIEMLCQEGEIVAISAHKRIRSLNPTGGAAVVKEKIFDDENSRAMEEYAKRFLKELTWNGVIMFEFKMDKKEKNLKLLEINGRFWGSLPLAIFSGVDFPYLFFQQAQGDFVGKKNEVVQSQNKIMSRHLLGDTHNLLLVFFKNDKMRKIVYLKRIKAFKEFFALHKNQKYDVFSLSDPKPFLFEVIDIVKRKL